MAWLLVLLGEIFGLLNTLWDFISKIMHTNAVQRIAEDSIFPERVRWAPTPDGPPGIRVWRDDQSLLKHNEYFVTWEVLEPELRKNLLIQVAEEPEDFRFAVLDSASKRNWLVQIVDTRGAPRADVWFGGNPEDGWGADGLIRIGAAGPPPHVFQTYRRFSNGTYERLPSAYHSLESVPSGHPLADARHPRGRTKSVVARRKRA